MQVGSFPPPPYLLKLLLVVNDALAIPEEE